MDVGKRLAEYAVREAVEDDLDTIAELTRARRGELAGWAPTWWAKSESADEIHPLWLAHLLAGGAARTLVVLADDAAVGCAVVLDQGSQFFVDDVAIRGDHLSGGIRALVEGTRDLRPALTCVPTQDESTIAAFSSTGATLVSTYWINETTADTLDVGAFDADISISRPRHTFGGRAFDPEAKDALAFTSTSGSVIASPSISAPPVYDPGGTVTVADLVTGSDLRATLLAARSAAGSRGDALITVVCDPSHQELIDALGWVGFRRTVEVYEIPSDAAAGDQTGDHRNGLHTATRTNSNGRN
jgi:hypothetical protein